MLGKECLCKEFDQLLLTVKSETEYSDDSAPGAADAVLFTGRPTITTIAETAERDIARRYWGNNLKEFVGKFVQIDGVTELMGAGTPGDLPNISALLRSAGLTEVQTPGTEVVYTPASSDIQSCSIYFYDADELWTVVGARADLTLNFANTFPTITWRIIGLFQLPTPATTVPTPTFPSAMKPLVMSYENTPVANFFGEDVDIDSFSLALNNSLSPRDVPGCYAVQIVDRAPSCTLVTCAPDLADISYYEKATNAELGTFAMEHGTTAGLINGISMPSNQIDLPNLRVQEIPENKKGMSVPFMPLPVVGNDEFSLTFK